MKREKQKLAGLLFIEHIGRSLQIRLAPMDVDSLGYQNRAMAQDFGDTGNRHACPQHSGCEAVPKRMWRKLFNARPLRQPMTQAA